MNLEYKWSTCVDRAPGRREDIARVKGRAPGTTLSVAGDWARITVPGLADAIFWRRDAVRLHKPREGEPQSLSNLSRDAIGVIAGFLDPSSVQALEHVLLGAHMGCAFIPIRPHHATLVRQVDTRPPWWGSRTDFSICAEDAISIDPDTLECSLELPRCPEAWARFQLPAAWASALGLLPPREHKRTRHIAQ